MDSKVLTVEEQKQHFNYVTNKKFIRHEMRIREEIAIITRKLRKTVHNPYTEEQQEELRKEEERLTEELYKFIQRSKWGDWNYWELRHLNIAYRIIRGKEPIYPTKKKYSDTKVDDIVKRYTKDWYSDLDEYERLRNVIYSF